MAPYVAEAAEPPKEVVWTKDTLIQLAHDEAVQDNLNSDHFVKVMRCEIGKNWDYKGQSFSLRPDGTRENSWGMWQIFLSAHVEISKEMAQDPIWATHWAGTMWRAGNYRLWSCYKIEEAEGWPEMN
jgi:hypothetical protein